MNDDLAVRRTTRAATLPLAAVGLITALAGCSGDADAAEGSATGSGSGSEYYAYGTYSADGSYQSPGGQESVSVSITLEGDVVTAVTVTPHATSGNSKQYQTQFASGIADQVVGKDIDSLDVSRVAGSSLTSGGFNQALQQIRADAAS